MKIRSCDIHLADLQTRMPFKYGIATMTRVPHAFVRVHLEDGGKSHSGISADLLPPKWFTKDPEKPVADEVAEMLRVIEHAARFATGLTGATVFELWGQLYRAQDDWAKAEKLPPLLAHFGTSLIERALIEAACRAADLPFFQMLTANRLGLDLGAIHPELQGRSPSEFLPRQPLPRVIARHTIGLADPLRDDAIPAKDKLDDGLPQSLEACVRAYGLRHFKVKVTGHLDHDLDRLEQIARVLESAATPDFRFTLDGNEQFHWLAHFRSYWQSVAERATLKSFLPHLLFIEQPLHRSVALESNVRELFDRWPERPPVIIDESDGALDSAAVALGLGYAGTSHKNCKGVFKGIANRCLLALRAQSDPKRQLVMSGEDLCTIGPVSVIQDLTVMSALAIESVERNGHHYFPGLSMWPEEIQKQVLACHGQLYRTTDHGWPALDLREGQLAVAALHRYPLGVGFAVDVERFTPSGRYRPA